MSRVQWRKVLPTVQLVAYIALVWYGCPYRRTWQAWLTPQSQSSENWQPKWIDGPPSPAEQIALGLNFPAVLSTGLLVPFDSGLRDGASKELAEHVVMAVFVPLLWFMVGKRLDQRDRPPSVRPSLTARVLVWVGLVVAIGTAVLMIVALLRRFGEIVLGRILTLAWAAFGIVLWSRAVRRWRTAQSLIESRS